jgi:hypothetical protein
VRAWLIQLVRGRILELTLALALGIALAALVKAVAALGLDILGQRVGRNPFGDGAVSAPDARYLLNFEVGSTVIFYGDVLAAFLALGLLCGAALIVVRRRDRELGMCPFCASRVPHESTHCAYCGSGMSPGEP